MNKIIFFSFRVLPFIYFSHYRLLIVRRHQVIFFACSSLI
nr:MAG TPA: hypothetical protein [Caudoviricetes sp.]